MRAELDSFEYILSNSSKFNQEILIRYLIPSDYQCTVPRDAYLSGEGSFCDEFQLQYYILLPQYIKQRILKGKGKYSELISINCLEFIIIIISYNTVLDAIELLGYVVNIPYLKAFILANNKSSNSYILKLALSSVISKRLYSILCSILMKQVLALGDNIYADIISRLLKDNLTYLTALLQRFLNLSTYCYYYLALELILVLFNALLNKYQEVQTQLRFKRYF